MIARVAMTAFGIFQMTGCNIARSLRTNDSQAKKASPRRIDRVIGAMKMGLFHPLLGPSVRARLKRAREDMMRSAPNGSSASHENLVLVDLGSAAGRSRTAITAWDQLQPVFPTYD